MRLLVFAGLLWSWVGFCQPAIPQFTLGDPIQSIGVPVLNDIGIRLFVRDVIWVGNQQVVAADQNALFSYRLGNGQGVNGFPTGRNSALTSRLSLHSDGRTLLFANVLAPAIRMRDATNGEALPVRFGDQDSSLGNVGVSPDGRHLVFRPIYRERFPGMGTGDLVARGNGLQVVSLPAQNVVRTLPLPMDASIDGGIAFTSDSRWVVGGFSKTLYVWELSSGRLIQQHTLPLTGESIVEVALSPDDTFVAISIRRDQWSEGGNVRIYELSNGASYFTFPRGDIPKALRFSTDGRWLTWAEGREKGHLFPWISNLSAPRQTGHVELRQRNNVLSSAVAFSPDNNHFVVGGRDSLNLYRTSYLDARIPRQAEDTRAVAALWTSLRETPVTAIRAFLALAARRAEAQQMVIDAIDCPAPQGFIATETLATELLNPNTPGERYTELHTELIRRMGTRRGIKRVAEIIRQAMPRLSSDRFPVRSLALRLMADLAKIEFRLTRDFGVMRNVLRYAVRPDLETGRRVDSISSARTSDEPLTIALDALVLSSVAGDFDQLLRGMRLLRRWDTQASRALLRRISEEGIMGNVR